MIYIKRLGPELISIANKVNPGTPAVFEIVAREDFVIVMSQPRGERIPLTLADFDPGKGTITLVVQAVENCQVSIIHPGRPRNPQEPGLEERVDRAQPFLEIH